MEYQPDAGHQAEGSELIYLQNGQQYSTQALAAHHVGYYQNTAPYHQFLDKRPHHYGKQGLGHELVVPACPGSGSSEASDDGGLRYAYPENYIQQETLRCDSSRSESTCSSMSSGSGTEDGLVRVPLLLPQGFPPGYLPQPGLLRVGQPNGIKAMKHSEMEPRVYDQSVYGVRSHTEQDNRASVIAAVANLPPPPLQPVPTGWRRLIAENSVIYLTPSNVALNSMDQVKMYLMSSGTCKCGLECPVHCDVVFSFNPKIASRPWDVSDSEMAKLCNHKRKTFETLEPRNIIEPAIINSNNISNNNNVVETKDQRDTSNVTQPPALSELPSTLKKKRRKQTSYSGVSVSQLLAQRERERALAAAAAVANGPRWPAPLRMPTRIYPEAFAVQPQFTTLRPQDPFTAMFPPGNRPRNIPPWHQARFAIRKPLNQYERVPSLQQHMPPPPPSLPIVPPPVIADLRRKHKPFREKKRKVHEPTFMDDPNGYLAQQTALLHNTIARPNMMQGVPLPSNVLPPKRPHHHQPCVTTGYTDCGRTRNDSSVTSTVVADPRPIQGGTVSTSNGSPTPLDPPPVCALPAQSPSNLLVSSSFDSPSNLRTGASKPPQLPPQRRDVVQTVVSNIQTSTNNGHILVSNTGQYFGGLKLNQPMGTVLVNALPAPFVLQQGVMTVDTGLGPMAVAGNVLVDNPPSLLSPDKKKKAKKRKGTPLGSPILQVPQGNNVVLNQGFGGMQAVTLVQGMQGMQQVQGKPVMVNNPINVIQPMVHNFPIQQFLVPSLGNMVMASDGSTALLPDHSMPQLQLQPLITNTGFITPTGMLIRSPNNLVSQVSPTEYIQIVPQNNASVVQNTTIVQQQTTMMGNVDKALELEIVASNSATSAADVSTQTNQGKETNHTFCQTVGSPPDTTTRSPLADTTTDDQQTVSSSVTDDKLRLLGYLSPNGRDDTVGSSHSDMDSQTMLSGVSPISGYIREKSQEEILNEGDLVWGPAGGSPAWPGKIVSSVTDGVVNVRWFGGISSSTSRIRVSELKTLSQGLDTHHQACQSPKRSRKLRAELQAAIQEAMAELDKIAARKRYNLNVSGRTRRSLR